MFIPNSFIKNIAIEIKEGYKLTNTPFTSDAADGEAETYFVGRKTHKQKFLKFLYDSSKGIFLVTGERGIGKTSFVNHVLKEYKNVIKKKNAEEAKINQENGEQTKVKPEVIKTIHLTLSQNRPEEIDILWLMVSTVYDKFKIFIDDNWKKYDTVRKIKTKKQHLKIALLAAAFCCISFLFLIWKANQKWTVEYPTGSGFIATSDDTYFLKWCEPLVYTSLFISFLAFTILLIFFLKQKVLEGDQKKKNNPQNRIEKLRDRCNALLTEESGSDEDINIQGINGLFGGQEKTTKNYSIASIKEIEYELLEFLEQSVKVFKLKFVFIFDELDKVDPVVTSTYLYDDSDKLKKNENANPHDFRDRKQAVINLIAGLKNFFTAAKARFIFIAGNEMFDAALADIADRQASISSIFTYTFHIESFLKEKHVGKFENNPSLSLATEEYLKWVLFRVKEQDEQPEVGKGGEIKGAEIENEEVADWELDILVLLKKDSKKNLKGNSKILNWPRLL